MRCPICSHETADDSNFCGHCGAKLIDYKREKENSPVSKETQPAVEVQENIPVSKDNMPADSGTQLEPAPAAQPAQTLQNNSAPNAPQFDYTFAFAPKKKSKAPIIAIIAVVLAAAVAALYFFGVFAAGPLVSIAKAADKTAQSKNFHFTMEITANEQTLEMDGTLLFDPALQKIELYMKANLAGEDETLILLLKDSILLIDDAGFIDTNDISEYLDTFWVEYKSGAEVKWSDWLESFGVSPSEVDFDKFDEAAESFIVNLNDEDYINEKLGSYEKTTSSGTTNHAFEIKFRNLSKELLNVFGESFRLKDEADRTDAEEDLYNNLKDTLGGTKLELNFSVKNGYLTGFGFDSVYLKMDAVFSDFGKAEIDESIVDKYDKYFKNQPKL